MLYHLIQLNPNKDITLHVSVNNPAMVGSSQSLSSLWILELIYFSSYYIIASDSRLRSLCRDFMKITSIANRARQRMPLG